MSTNTSELLPLHPELYAQAKTYVLARYEMECIGPTTGMTVEAIEFLQALTHFWLLRMHLSEMHASARTNMSTTISDSPSVASLCANVRRENLPSYVIGCANTRDNDSLNSAVQARLELCICLEKRMMGLWRRKAQPRSFWQLCEWWYSDLVLRHCLQELFIQRTSWSCYMRRHTVSH